MKYAIAINAGITALHSAFFACKLGPGDEVLSHLVGLVDTKKSITKVYRTV